MGVSLPVASIARNVPTRRDLRADPDWDERETGFRPSVVIRWRARANPQAPRANRARRTRLGLSVLVIRLVMWVLTVVTPM